MELYITHQNDTIFESVSDREYFVVSGRDGTISRIFPRDGKELVPQSGFELANGEKNILACWHLIELHLFMNILICISKGRYNLVYISENGIIFWRVGPL